MLPPLIPVAPKRRKAWGTAVERERRNRILVSIYAYAYEYQATSLVTDAEYDRLARTIQPHIGTGNHEIDTFFRRNYTADTGMWIGQHPHFDRIADIYWRYYVQ